MSSSARHAWLKDILPFAILDSSESKISDAPCQGTQFIQFFGPVDQREENPADRTFHEPFLPTLAEEPLDCIPTLANRYLQSCSTHPTRSWLLSTTEFLIVTSGIQTLTSPP